MKTVRQISAGGVVYRVAADQIEYIICRHTGDTRWILPKGWVERDESHEVAALREVQEETGVRATVVVPLGEPEAYWFVHNGVRIHKRVYYFLMKYASGSIDDHDHEIEAVRWVTLEQGEELLAFKGAREMLRRAHALITVSKT